MINTSVKLGPYQERLLEGAKGGYFGWTGMQVALVSPGASVVTMTPRAEMLTPWNTLNGGVINGILELPSFVALLTVLGDGELPVTNDLFLQHLRPLPGDANYILKGTLIRRSKKMAWTEVTVIANENVVTIARITKTILQGRNS